MKASDSSETNLWRSDPDKSVGTSIQSQDRRKFHRIDCDEEVHLEFGDATLESCRIKNISLRGVFVAGTTLRDKARTCRVSIFYHAKNRRPRLHASATVVWSNEEGMGLQFTSMTRDSSMVLLSALINRANQPAVILREFPRTLPFEITGV